jgi:Uma2 family endonuclease
MPTQTALKLEEHYSWKDYLGWPDSERWEIVAGKAYAMSPSPLPVHQMISAELHSRMQAFFKGKKCRVFAAPMDVRLSDEDVVQPDLLVVCDPKQIRTHIEGPPALVVEIVSESSVRHDRMHKSELYARCGVKEYWIVTPFPCMVEVFLLEGARYTWWRTFGHEDTLTSPVFADLQIVLSEVFEFALEQYAAGPTVVKEPPAHYKTLP